MKLSTVVLLVVVWLGVPSVVLAGPEGNPAEGESQRSLEERVRELEIQLQRSNLENGAGASESGFSFGGYGEIHANFTEGGQGSRQIDIHRFVLYMGYDFDTWIKFHSETEIEHAFVSDGDGEVALEQWHFDFLLREGVNVRAGRVLIPVGITNWKHEPPSFNGVERPTFDTNIVPSTWFGDGVGIFGKLARDVRYQLYVVGGLDGSKFSATKGIRDGRLKERPSLNEVAFTGRLDFYPYVRFAGPSGHTLRVGVSGYGGGSTTAIKERIQI